MAKRFTDTDKYKKPFIRRLPGAYKLFWDYLYHDCNHAGIWIADFEIAQIYLGSDLPIDPDEALRLFNQDETRVIPISGGKKWFIKSFVDFQYGKLNPSNRVHNSVIKELQKEGIYDPDKGWLSPLETPSGDKIEDNQGEKNKGHVSPLQGVKDKDKDKDKDMDKDKDKDLAREENPDQLDRVNGAPVPESLRYPELIQAYKKYLEYFRQNYNRPKTAIETETDLHVLTELHHDSNDPVKVIVQTIQASNKSFYELKEKQFKKNKESNSNYENMPFQ